MDRKSIFFITTAVLLAGVIGMVLFTNPRTPLSVSPTTSPSPSPSPKEELINGKVTDISGPVDFKNSLLVILDSDGTKTTIYVPEDTEIMDQQGRKLLRNQLRVGSEIEVSGTATEGGILAEEITVLSLATPKSSPSPTGSPSSSPTQSPSPSP
jgi:hypothetical protein